MGFRSRSYISICAYGLLVFACAAEAPKGPVTKSEQIYCTPKSVSGAKLTISGTGFYQAREITNQGLGGPTPNRPIRFAEVEVYKVEALPYKGKSSVLVQCGETDENGEFNLQVPKSPGAYQVRINSRAYNDKIRASVLSDPTNNRFYSLRAEVTTTGGDIELEDDALIAPYNESLEGGAFNILDKVYLANEYLRRELNSDNHGCVACQTDFVVAPRVRIFWKPGFNPGTYYGMNSPISFYIPAQKSLYISGGDKGDTDNMDTDHFDDSIILHEYAHFLEDQLSKSDSPGGSHDGNSIIDPRLAWGEGWANFFQAAVRGEPNYLDTYGNSDGTEYGYYFEVDLTNTMNSPKDIASERGEGNFREFSITRLLWSLIHPTPNPIVDFAYLWEVVTNPDWGFRSNSLSFRNIGHFYELLYSLASDNGVDTSLIQAKLDGEFHRENRQDYARPLEPKAPDQCDVIMTIEGDYTETSATGSNQFKSNDFYIYNHPGGALDILLTYGDSDNEDALPHPDLDLYVYKEGYTYNFTNGIVGYSYGYYNESDFGEERVRVNKVPAGKYLINVKVYTGESFDRSPAQYELYANETTLLCPHNYDEVP